MVTLSRINPSFVINYLKFNLSGTKIKYPLKVLDFEGSDYKFYTSGVMGKKELVSEDNVMYETDIITRIIFEIKKILVF